MHSLEKCIARVALAGVPAPLHVRQLSGYVRLQQKGEPARQKESDDGLNIRTTYVKLSQKTKRRNVAEDPL